MFRDEIMSGQKKQTIRKLRKNPIMVDDRLYLYWHLRQRDCEKLGEADCSQVAFISFNMASTPPMITQALDLFPFQVTLGQGQTLSSPEVEDLAIQDSFKSAIALFEFFERIHNPQPEDVFQVIRWGKLEQTSRVGCSAVGLQRERLV